MKKEKVVFILGPTAVGKSGFAVELAKKFNGEIISADSVQIFKGLNIGSAKITKKEMQNVAHHGIDICEPEEEFSAFNFVQFTEEKIQEISKRKHLPIVVGGTGLYVKALTQGYNFGGTNKDEKLRQELEDLLKNKGVEGLFELLQKLDAHSAETIDKNNPVRLIRAIEIAKNNGRKTYKQSGIEALVFALERPREELYKDINARTEKMFKDGLVQEVQALKEQGLTENNQSMRAIGYKEVLSFLKGEISKEQMVELVKQHSRNYAKRQITFLRSMEGVCYIEVSDRQKAIEQMENKIKEFLKC